MENKITNRYVLVDLIRVIAISLVAFAHIASTWGSRLGSFFGVENLYYVTLGGIGVTLFLIISGFSIDLSYRKKKYNYWYFIKDRLKRI